MSNDITAARKLAQDALIITESRRLVSNYTIRCMATTLTELADALEKERTRADKAEAALRGNLQEVLENGKRVAVFLGVEEVDGVTRNVRAEAAEAERDQLRQEIKRLRDAVDVARAHFAHDLYGDTGCPRCQFDDALSPTQPAAQPEQAG